MSTDKCQAFAMKFMTRQVLNVMPFMTLKWSCVKYISVHFSSWHPVRPFPSGVPQTFARSVYLACYWYLQSCVTTVAGAALQGHLSGQLSIFIFSAIFCVYKIRTVGFATTPFLWVARPQCQYTVCKQNGNPKVAQWRRGRHQLGSHLPLKKLPGQFSGNCPWPKFSGQFTMLRRIGL